MPLSPLAPLADTLYREEVERARRMIPSDKLLEGPRLFERASRLMMDGLRHQHPELDATGLQALATRRLTRLRTLERG